MGNAINRVLAALPDAVTSVIFLIAWIAPARLGPVWVKNLMLTMLIEFVVMHSGAFYAAIAGKSADSRVTRSVFLIAVTAFYCVFIAGFSLAFKSTWPLFAFGWLFVSRFAGLWTNQNAAQRDLLSRAWLASVIFYLLGVFATIVIPLPRFGLSADFVASMQLSGRGLWIEKPQTVMVFGALYFGALASFRFYLARTATPSSAAVRDTAT